ncbi:MAG TPA: hypothetical protein VND64_30735 [Pirellulales bacterium]|nr:hypothetical protein [Pirellulales bacterium]
MNDRVRAMTLLQEAREILAQRLTERVLELGDELLDDARGESFAGEIDGLYEQIGLRLSQVNSLLAGLPPTSVLAAPTGQGPFSTVEVSAASNGMMGFLPQGETEAGHPHLAQQAAAGNELTMLRMIVDSLINGDVETAGGFLSWWFEAPLEHGRRCATAFRERWASEPDFPRKAKQLRQELTGGSWSQAVSLWHDCFGISPAELPASDAPRTFRIPRVQPGP